MKAAWSRKAVLRKNGQMMRNVRVTFAIGREQAMIAAVRYGSTYGDAPTTRKQLTEMIDRYLYDHGWPSGEDIEEADDEDVKAAYAAVDKLMPELKATEK